MRENPLWTAAQWLSSAVFVCIWAVIELMRASLLLLAVLAAMIVAYHATVPVAAFLPGDPPHALIWVLIFLMLISPALGWFVHRIRKEDLEAKEKK